MNSLELLQHELNRRAFLGRTARGLGGLALASLLDPRLLRGETPPATDGPWPGVARPLHFPPRAKRAIWLYMAGGPSHLETFDPKPRLAELHGQPMPKSFTEGQQVAQLQGQELKCFAPQFAFQRCGQSGQQISTQFPQLGRIADDICIVRSMHTDQINHDTAHTVMNTGSSIAGRPSMGSWLLYGLGSESEDLPGFVVLISSGGGQDQPVAQRQWHSGFLPSRFQGVHFRSTGEAVSYLANPPGVGDSGQRRVIDAVNRLNALQRDRIHDPEIATRISQYEMAFRMQTSVPELMDLSQEPDHILDLYGTRGADGSFAANCLLARRMAERGVRFIQLYHRGWDHHGGIKKGIEIVSSHVDRGCAALLTDLKQRGMLEDTLVIWGGEFGRTPMAQGDGRDHHIKGFSMWLAGAGIKPGMTYGATDELGYNAVENPVHVNDLHATALRLFGIDHLRLTYRFQGRDFRLTDIAGRVVGDILA
ncbi:MAG: DUF1501 domain-containing protein [Verrucomicrobiales bacterium]|nr:DUF1501 domain-containing protein [Verrucomicrobiales bacterium]